MMDPRSTNSIKLYILAVWTLLLTSSSRLSCDARITRSIYMPKRQEISIKNAAETDVFPSSNAHSQPTPPFRVLENHPPLCLYPPPSSLHPSPTNLPPPTHISSPPSTSSSKPDHGVWCVAKPTVPASQLQQALDYACASGADCKPIQLNGACYQPDTVLAHASYAFNSYWERNKEAGGTCDFGGSAMLVTVDPSYDQCHFIFS